MSELAGPVGARGTGDELRRVEADAPRSCDRVDTKALLEAGLGGRSLLSIESEDGAIGRAPTLAVVASVNVEVAKDRVCSASGGRSGFWMERGPASNDAGTGAREGALGRLQAA